MKAAVVTGASGFVGKQLTSQLAEDGYQVYAVLRPGNPWQPPVNVTVVYCGLDSLTLLPQKLSLAPGALFFHMAWDGSAGIARADTELQLSNVRWACDAVRAAAALGCSRFIGAGSIMEDECLYTVPVEGSTPGAAMQYSIAKLTAHFMAKTEAARQKIEFVWGKISNAYGATDTTERFINLTLQKMLKNQPCELTACTQLYDFCYITEVARAFKLMAESGRSGCAYYIGSGECQPLRAFLTQMKVVASSTSDLQFGAAPFVGTSLPEACFDTVKLARDTGFFCQIPFSQGIHLTIEWFSQH